jgi:hypothetical protein
LQTAGLPKRAPCKADVGWTANSPRLKRRARGFKICGCSRQQAADRLYEGTPPKPDLAKRMKQESDIVFAAGYSGAFIDASRPHRKESSHGDVSRIFRA